MTSVSPVSTHAELASRLRLAVTRLARRLRQQSAADITPSMMAALSSVERLGPLSLGELAAVERVQPPTMTRIVGGLEELKLVEREVDSRDRRVVRVRLTAEGRRFGLRVRSRKNAYLATQLRSLGPDELATLEKAAAILERFVEDAE